MYLQRLYIGLNDRDLHRQIVSMERAKEVIKDILSGNYVSYTMIECEGIFLRESEQTIIIEHYATGEGLLIDNMHISAIKNILNQDCILQTIEEVKFKLI